MSLIRAMFLTLLRTVRAHPGVHIRLGAAAEASRDAALEAET
jgi:hypothetical protein